MRLSVYKISKQIAFRAATTLVSISTKVGDMVDVLLAYSEDVPDWVVRELAAARRSDAVLLYDGPKRLAAVLRGCWRGIWGSRPFLVGTKSFADFGFALHVIWSEDRVSCSQGHRGGRPE